MRTNVKRSSGARRSGHPSGRALEATDDAHASKPQTEPPGSRPRNWAEDRSDPSKQRQMSAVWPLLWLALPLFLLVVYGLLSSGRGN